jgi:hypothetical protein
MKEFLNVLLEQGLADADAATVEQVKADAEAAGRRLLGGPTAGIYPNSLHQSQGILYCVARNERGKSVLALAPQSAQFPFDGPVEQHDGYYMQRAEPGPQTARVLHELFPFTRPVSLRDKRTTIGMGDRLGMASAGQIRAARRYQVSPVLAQQSVRELKFTGRTFADVVADATFLVFQEGFEAGYGADGDHLKSIDQIDTALAERMPMITLDLTEVLVPDAANWSGDRLENAYKERPADFRSRVEREYAGQSFNLGNGVSVSISEEEAKRCAVMYGEALDFAVEVDQHLKAKTGNAYDLEVSIDETSSPTLPEHHLFIAREMEKREVSVNSVAPRFIGDFQKAVDYIGDPAEFERQFAVHCEIARSFGTYKISVHSGSDKFSVYPIIGRHTEGRFHLKTAGTSWLESIRVMAEKRPDLYRRIHRKAYDYFAEAKKQYAITTNVDAIRDLDEVGDEQLPSFLEDPNCRQLLHITYGGLLNDEELRQPFFTSLYQEEEAYNDALYALFDKHLGLLFGERR